MNPSVFLIGAGAAGGSLIVGMARAGYRPIGVFDVLVDRARELGRELGCPGFACTPDLLARASEAELVIVATPDADIERVARLAVSCEAFRDSQVWLHLAGALDETALRALQGHVRGLAACHPACAFPRGRISAIPKGTCFGLTGDDEGVRAARGIVAALEGVTVEVPAVSRARYHAAAVMASNLVVALLAAARDTLVELGVGAQDAESLVVALGASAVDRAAEYSLTEGLTGPISRGDVTTVAAHLEALRDDRASELYRALSRVALRLTKERGGLDASLVEAIEKQLSS